MKSSTKGQNMCFKSFGGKGGYLGWENEETIPQGCGILDGGLREWACNAKIYQFSENLTEMKKINMLLLEKLYRNKYFPLCAVVIRVHYYFWKVIWLLLEFKLSMPFDLGIHFWEWIWKKVTSYKGLHTNIFISALWVVVIKWE